MNTERDARIAELERIMTSQRERIIELEREIATLHAALKALQQQKEKEN